MTKNLIIQNGLSMVGNRLQSRRKQYTVTVKGRVQRIGFRGYLQETCERLRIPCIAYNSAPEELKILCEAERDAVENLTSLIREYRLGEINDLKIEEGVQLPYPPVRAVIGIEEEIYGRMDEGVRLLNSIDTKLDNTNDKLGKLDSMDAKLGKLDSMDAKLGKLDSMDAKLGKLDEIASTLKDISNNLRKN